jgi:AcrR family transcriptional regulator
VASRREQILAAARDLFLKQGLSGFSMRRVAAQAEISATAIYRHFKDKDALLQAVVEEGFLVFASYLFRSLEGKTPLERLTLAGENYIRFSLEQPKYYRLIFMSWFDEKKPEFVAKRAEEQRGQAPTFQFLLDRVDECIKEGIIKGEVQAMDAALGIWSQVHGLAALYLAGGARYQYSAEEYLAGCGRVIGQMLRGLLS